MKKVLILVNHYVVIYNFRKELVEFLIKEGFDVYLSCPEGERIYELQRMGCKYIKTELSRRSTSFTNEIKLLMHYKRIMKTINPDVVLSYTIKPNLYGGMVAAGLDIPYIANITGLGTAIIKGGTLSRFIKKAYKFSFRKANCVFFQNQENKAFFIRNDIIHSKYRLVPGSGVNLVQFNKLDYPIEESIGFVFIARIMKEKGIEHYLEAAEFIKAKYPYASFHICGFCEEAYEDILKQKHKIGVITYHGMVSDVREILAYTHCVIHPSYHEGMSNVLLEASASGRPCLCSDIPGCREIVNDGVTGFLFEPKSTQSLIDAIEKFLALSYEEHKKMGINARKKVEKEFSRQIVINAYMEEINKITEAVK